ncbi:hypothetical protein J6590_094046 [Homalodisca vitripennis]|nr:hypothetical protein J6590_094046 [Homalodisca vitripennis]
MFKFHRLDVRRKVASLVFLRGVMSGSVDDPELLACVPWHVPRRGSRATLTWALMELFWTNEKAAMAARPRPLPPSPPPSHTPRPLLDPLRRPPANGRAASPPPYESDGGRAMADGVMADEQKFVSPAAGIRTRAPTNARLSR